MYSAKLYGYSEEEGVHFPEQLWRAFQKKCRQSKVRMKEEFAGYLRKKRARDSASQTKHFSTNCR